MAHEKNNHKSHRITTAMYDSAGSHAQSCWNGCAHGSWRPRWISSWGQRKVSALGLEGAAIASGYRPRRLDTRMGTMYLMVPKVRQGGYTPFFVTERKRSEAALIQVVQESFLQKARIHP